MLGTLMSPPRDHQPAPRSGRPRDAAIDAAVLGAVSDLLDERGYRSLAVEEVARRAGVSKTAIYRRWPTRQSLVLGELRRRLGEVEPADTGCTLCDVHEALSLFARTFACMGPEILSPLLADCSGDPALRASFTEQLFDPPRQAVRVTLQRAVARGDLRPDIDLDLAVDMLASLVHYRLLFGHGPVDDAALEAAVTSLLAGLTDDLDGLRGQAVAHDPRHATT